MSVLKYSSPPFSSYNLWSLSCFHGCILTPTVRADYHSCGTRCQCTSKQVILAFSMFKVLNWRWINSTCLKNSIWLVKNVNLRLLPVKFPPNFLEKYYCTKSFVPKRDFRGIFLSYHVYFRRYGYFWSPLQARTVEVKPQKSTCENVVCCSIENFDI